MVGVCDYLALTGDGACSGVRCGCGQYPVSVTFEIKMAVCDMQSLTLQHQTPAAIFLR